MKILILSSTHHWTNGWFIKPASLEAALPHLQGLGYPISTQEVTTATELERVLAGLDAQTLVWPNAYYVQDGKGGTVWIQEELEKKGIPFLGNPLEALQAMLHKQQTQALLQAAGVPVPGFLHLRRTEIAQLEGKLAELDLGWPLAIKPTSESCSMGIKRVHTLSEAHAHLAELFADYPQSDAILESFLPSEDVTCGYLQLGDEVMLLPTYYSSTQVSGKENMVERDMGTGPWGGEAIIMPPVQEPEILRQLQEQVPKIVQALHVRGLTRADGRLDAQGKLRFFDVNGMPALTFPKSVLVRQVRECFPGVEATEAYRRLVNTIVLQAVQHHGFAPTPQLVDSNLFTLTGGHVIRFSGTLA